MSAVFQGRFHSVDVGEQIRTMLQDQCERENTSAERVRVDKEQFICGICREHFKTPRYLPTCGHTFCEICLLKYTRSKLRSDQHHEGKLECPVCRRSYNLPENNTVTLEWIQTFPLNTVTIKVMDNESISTGQDSSSEIRRECDPCRERGETAAGRKFCLDCKEVYCETCTDCHNSFKISKEHKLLDLSEESYETKRSDFYSLFANFSKCQKHSDRETGFICRTHNAIMCVLCLKGDHKLCDFEELPNHAVDVDKLTEELAQWNSQFRTAIDHLNQLLTIMEDNKTELSKAIERIQDDIKHIRDQVVQVVDDIVSRVSNLSKQIAVENGDRIDEDISRVARIQQIAEEKADVIDIITEHGSVKHKIIASHTMGATLAEIDRQIYQENKHLKSIQVELVIADDLRKLIEGGVEDDLVEVKLTEVEKDTRHISGVSKYRRDEPTRVEEHRVRPNARCGPRYHSIAMHNDGRVILSDYCNSYNCRYLCLYNRTTKTMLRLRLNLRPFSGTQVDDTHLAVSIPGNKTIIVVAVENDLRVEKTLKTRYQPQTIVALSNGNLAVAWDNPPAFGIIDINGTSALQQTYFKQDKRGRKLKSFSYMAVDEKRHYVIQSCIRDKAVYCFDFTGEPVFKFTDPGLTKPRGVALENDGNIYICQCEDPGRIFKLSPTGALITTIRDGVPVQPLTICCDNFATGLWLTNGSSVDKVVFLELEQMTLT